MQTLHIVVMNKDVSGVLSQGFKARVQALMALVGIWLLVLVMVGGGGGEATVAIIGLWTVTEGRAVIAVEMVVVEAIVFIVMVVVAVLVVVLAVRVRAVGW